MTKNDPVRRYLAELEAALQGADSALIHDALIDAETHLEDAIFSGVPSGDAIRDFGTPAEIAAAYLAAETARQRPPAPPAVAEAGAPVRPLSSIPFVGIWFDRYAWGSAALLTFGAIFSVAAALWVYGLGIIALGTAPLLVGLALLIVVLGSARVLSLTFGKLVEFCTGIRMPHRSRPVDLAGAKGFFRRLGCWLKDLRSWLSLAFVMGNVWVAVPVAFVFSFLFSFGASLLFSFFGTPWSDADITVNGHSLPGLMSFLDSFPGQVATCATGFLVLTVTLWLSKGVAQVYAMLVKAIQVVRPEAK